MVKKHILISCAAILVCILTGCVSIYYFKDEKLAEANYSIVYGYVEFVGLDDRREGRAPTFNIEDAKGQPANSEIPELRILMNADEKVKVIYLNGYRKNASGESDPILLANAPDWGAYYSDAKYFKGYGIVLENVPLGDFSISSLTFIISSYSRAISDRKSLVTTTKGTYKIPSVHLDIRKPGAYYVGSYSINILAIIPTDPPALKVDISQLDRPKEQKLLSNSLFWYRDYSKYYQTIIQDKLNLLDKN